MKKAILLPLLLLIFALPSGAQHTTTWDEIADYIVQYQEDGEDAAWMKDLEELELLASAPININCATREELRSLPFLTEQNVTELREYVARHHGMKTTYELRLIRSLGIFERTLLSFFIYCGETPEAKTPKITAKSLFDHPRHEVLTRVDIPFYHRKGYLVDNGYRGSRITNKTQYSYTGSRHLQASLHAERDAGERGIDSYGGQVMLKDIGCMSRLVVGDFRAGFGEGLVINQGFSMSKSSPLSRPSQGIRAARGTDEVQFMRGVGTTLRFGGFNISGFYNYRAMDASLNSDGSVKTIQKSGYHRTASEFSNKNVLHANTVGFNTNWSDRHWHTGLTGYAMFFDRTLSPGNEYYRRIYPRGRTIANLGTDYGYTCYQWSMKGETAFDPIRKGIATLNVASLNITPLYMLSVAGRYYSHHYYSFYSSAMTETSGVQNESAVTIRLDAKPADGLQTELYADFFHNTWPRYGIDHSSNGQEAVAVVQYRINRNHQVKARYSFKRKDSSSGMKEYNRMRLQWIAESSERWQWQTTAAFCAMKGSLGESLGETIRFGLSTSVPLRFSLSAIYFHTDDYDSRISLYEPNVAGSMSIPSFAGHGTRFAGNIQYQFWKQRLRLELKYGLTCYFDRTTQSSGMQTIYSRYKNELTLQLRCKI